MHDIRKLLLKIVLTTIMAAGFAISSHAQKLSLSTNLVEWGNYGTINLDGGMSVSQHFSLFAGVKYNPWEFRTSYGMLVFNQQATVNAGVRYWPWYVFSGWWLGAKVRYTDFEQSGVLRPKYFDGKSIGAGLSAGYTWMLNKHINLEVAAGIWGGRHLEYKVYRTVSSMHLLKDGPRNFYGLDDVAVTLMYVF